VVHARRFDGKVPLDRGFIDGLLGVPISRSLPVISIDNNVVMKIARALKRWLLVRLTRGARFGRPCPRCGGKETETPTQTQRFGGWLADDLKCKGLISAEEGQRLHSGWNIELIVRQGNQ